MPAPEPLPAGWRRIELEEIDSTNAEALRRAASGERGPLWITALRQTAGRGRAGRVWASAPGAIAATLLFRPQCPPGLLPQLSLVAGIAVHDAAAAGLAPEGRSGMRLKWPNDLMLAGAKASGILIESTLFGAEPVAAIGIGINVAAPPGLGGRTTTALADHGDRRAPLEVAGRLAADLSRWLVLWRRGEGFAAVREAWLERAGPIGEPMTVNAGGGPLAGTFAGLDAEGALLVRAQDGIRRFTFADVALGPPSV